MLLRNTSWETYERLLGESVENCGTRFAVRDKDVIDLEFDPPPELVVEVDISNCSLNRFSIFASVGVAEIRRYDGERVRFHKLDGDVYRPIEESIVLPPMTAAQATVFVERVRHEKARVWDRAVRSWLRGHIQHHCVTKLLATPSAQAFLPAGSRPHLNPLGRVQDAPA